MWEQAYGVPPKLKDVFRSVCAACTPADSDDGRNDANPGDSSNAGGSATAGSASVSSTSNGDGGEPTGPPAVFADTQQFVEYYLRKFSGSSSGGGMPGAGGGENGGEGVGANAGADAGADAEETWCQAEQQYADRLQRLEQNSQAVVRSVDRVLQQLSHLEIANIETSTTLQDLHFHCDTLNNEFARLSQIADRIQGPLQFFDDLVHISSTVDGQILSKRHRHTDLDDDRVCRLMHETGQRVRACIRFLEANHSFHDAPQFLTKYRTIEAKLVGAMKDQVVAIFDTAVARIRTELATLSPLPPPSSPSSSAQNIGDVPAVVATDAGGAAAAGATGNRGIGSNDDDAVHVTSFYYIKFLSYSASARDIVASLESGAAAEATAATLARDTATAAPLGGQHGGGGSGGGDDTATGGSHSAGSQNVYSEALSDVHEHFCTLRLSLLAGLFRARLVSIVTQSGGGRRTPQVQRDDATAAPSRDVLTMVSSSLLELEGLCDREVRHFLQHFRSTSTNPRVLARCLRELEAAEATAATTTTTTKTKTAGDGHAATTVAAAALWAQGSQAVDRHSSLWNMLLFLGDAVYGALRAEIIQEGDVFRLCSVIDMLRTGAGSCLGEAAAVAVESAGLGALPPPLVVSAERKSVRACVDTVLSRLTRDTQERLAYRAEAFIKSSIRNFKTEAAHRASHDAFTARLDQRAAATGQQLSPPSHQRYHPLLQDTAAFLERVHRCVEPPMFQTLSQDCVKSCCLSLLDAAEAVDVAVRDRHPLRAPLFALAQFMALRELITRFDIRCTVTRRTLNFSQTRSAFGQLLGAGSSLFRWGSGNAFVKLLHGGVPTVSEEEDNIRDELEGHLQTARKQYITRGTDSVLRGLRAGDAESASTLQVAAVHALEATAFTDLENIRSEVHAHFPDGSAREVVLNPLVHALVRQLTTLRAECDAGNKGDVAAALDSLLRVVRGGAPSAGPEPTVHEVVPADIDTTGATNTAETAAPARKATADTSHDAAAGATNDNAGSTDDVAAGAPNESSNTTDDAAADIAVDIAAGAAADTTTAIDNDAAAAANDSAEAAAEAGGKEGGSAVIVTLGATAAAEATANIRSGTATTESAPATAAVDTAVPATASF